MMIYQFTDYKAYLREWLNQKKKNNSRVTFYKLAEEIQIQKTTFSKVLNGRANLTNDQAYLLALQVCASEEEKDYFYLLIEYAQTSIQKRKKDLEKKIQVLQRERYVTADSLSISDLTFNNDDVQNEYFNNPYIALVHIFLTIPKYQINVKLIAQELNLDLVELQNILKLLEKIRLISKVNANYYQVLKEHIQIKDRGNLVRSHQLLTHSIALSRMATLNLKQRYGISVSFSTDTKSIELCRQILIKAVHEISEIALKSKPESVHQLMIDFFPWSK